MTTEEKNELLYQANYLQGMADAFIEASYICSVHCDRFQLTRLAKNQLEKIKEIKTKIKD